MHTVVEAVFSGKHRTVRQPAFIRKRIGIHMFLPSLLSKRNTGSLVGLALLSLSPLPATAQTTFSIENSTQYTQNFNGLANSGTTASTVPTGWTFIESGTNANSTYGIGTGSDNTGNTYSFGSTGSNDRAFGTLLSNTVTPTIGGFARNTSGMTITQVSIGYTGEQWRLGATGRQDRLDFQYQTGATALGSGTWTDFNSLDFSSPVTTGTVGALNGNLSANRTVLASTALTGLTWNNNSNLGIRWSDFDVTGSDDGLGVDDFSLTATHFTASTSGNIRTGTFQNVTVNANITLTGATTFTTIAGSGGINLNNQTFTVNDGTYTGAFSGSNATVVKSGTGTLTLSGNSSGWSNGTLRLDAGTLAFTTANSLGGNDVGLRFNGGTLSFTGTSDVTISGNQNIESLNSNALRFDVANADRTLTINRNVTNSSAGLDKTGAGRLILRGNSNSYSGGTRVSGGTLILGEGGQYQGGATVSNGATLQLGTGTGSNPVNFSGDIANNGNVVFNNNGNVNFTNVISGTGSLTKQGSGTLTLTQNNTFTGTTTVSNGSLRLGDGNTTGSVGGNITLANNANLTFDRSGNFTYSNDISGTGTVVKERSGTLTLTGNNTHSGPTTVNGGTLQVGNGGTTGSITGNITLNNGADIAFNRSDNTTYSGNLSGNGSVIKQGAGTLTLSGNNSGLTGEPIRMDAGTIAFTSADNLGSSNLTLQFNGGGLSYVGTSNVTLGQILTTQDAADAFRFDVASASGTVTLSRTINSTSSGLIKTGDGTLILGAATNNYVGPTTISDGTLQVSTELSLGQGSNGVVFDGGTLRFTGSGNVVLSRDVSATANSDYSFNLDAGRNVILRNGDVLDGANSGLNKSGAGTLTLTNANTFGGETNVTGGTVALANANALQNSTVNLSVANGISFSGTSPINPNPTINLTSATFGGLSGSANLTLQNGQNAAVALSVGNNDENTTYTGILSGSGSLNKVGSGVLTLTGNHTYTGNTTITEGTLNLNGSVASTNPITVTSNARLTGNGNLGNIVLNNGGILDPGDADTPNAVGTITATSLTWNGGGKIQFRLGSSSATSDQIDLSGFLTKGTAGTFFFDFQGTGVAGETYTLIDFGDNTTGNAANDKTNFVLSDFDYFNMAEGLGGQFFINYVTGELLFTTTIVPEPDTLAFLLCAVGPMAYGVRRQKAS